MGRKQGTGKPDPKKDRSGHDAARAKKKMTLQDLVRELPTTDAQAHYITLVNRESDRGAAVMAASFVERTLEDQIKLNIKDPGGGVADGWFNGPNAPFATFSAKIALGRALGLFDNDIHIILVAIKNVRNTFAHRMLPLNFSHPTIVEECNILAPAQLKREVGDSRRVYVTSCLAMVRGLGRMIVGSAHLEGRGDSGEGGNK